jgi:hypothetical protein
MPTLVLRQTVSPARMSGNSTRRTGESKVDPSIEGVLIFSGIGLALMALAAIFQYMEVPPLYF